MYIKETVCTLYPFTSFTRKPPDESLPNFVQASTLTQGRFLTQVRPRQLDPLIPGVVQTTKPKQVTGEKTLLYKKCIKFFRPALGGPVG